jgi:hypothetical protein
MKKLCPIQLPSIPHVEGGKMTNDKGVSAFFFLTKFSNLAINFFWFFSHHIFIFLNKIIAIFLYWVVECSPKM